jgi:hypothetical protein
VKENGEPEETGALFPQKAFKSWGHVFVLPTSVTCTVKREGFTGLVLFAAGEHILFSFEERGHLGCSARARRHCSPKTGSSVSMAARMTKRSERISMGASVSLCLSLDTHS